MAESALRRLTDVLTTRQPSFVNTDRKLDTGNPYHHRARYYNPSLQRFISEDPIEFSGGDANLYAYTENSPVNFTDPWGEAIGVTPIGADHGAAVYNNYWTALLYLEQSPAANAIIQELEASSDLYKINISDTYGGDQKNLRTKVEMYTGIPT